MSNQVMERRWTQLRNRAQERWGRLTGDDLRQISGQREALEDKLRERYGLTVTEASNQVDSFLDETSRRAAEMQETLQDEVQDKRQRLQERVDEARTKVGQKAGEYDARLEEMQPQGMAQTIRSKPFLLLAIAALGGLVIGLWLKSMKS